MSRTHGAWLLLLPGLSELKPECYFTQGACSWHAKGNSPSSSLSLSSSPSEGYTLGLPTHLNGQVQPVVPREHPRERGEDERESEQTDRDRHRD